MISSRLRSLSPLLFSLVAVAACGDIASVDSPTDLVDDPDNLTIDTAGRQFMAPFEAQAQVVLRPVAATKARWDEIMSTAYGPDYDKTVAEQYRTKIAAGDFSWTPVVHLVPKGALGKVSGAYAASIQTVFIDESMPEGIARAVAYLEEIGHHLDTKLRKTDAPGDEGAIFRRMVLGDRPSFDELAGLKQANDHMTFVWQGKTLDVEHFGIGTALCVLDPVACITVIGAGSLAKMVYPGLPSVDQVIDWASKQAFGGADILKRWVGKGVGNIALRMFDTLPGNPLVAIQDFYAMKNAIFGSIQDLKDAATMFQRGIDRMSTGDWKNGLADIFVSMASAGATINGVNPEQILNTAQETLSGIQTRLGLEPIGRPLSSAERAKLWPVYRDALNYDPILLKEGFAGIYSINDRALTLQNTIYIKNDLNDETLVHENAHVWQFQHVGTKYKLEAIEGQRSAGYDWGLGLKQGQAFGNLNPEQQAQLIEAGFADVMQRGEMPINFAELTAVNVADAASYFVKGWNTVSGGGWVGKNWSIAGNPSVFHVGPNRACKVTADQIAIAGAATTIPKATLSIIPSSGTALPDCTFAELGPAPTSHAAFTWSQSSTGTVEPSSFYRYNSDQGTVKVTNVAVGQYDVRFANMANVGGGNVQVTAYGSGSERCKVEGWGPNGSDQSVRVRCFTAAGAPVNTLFTAAFQARTGITGQFGGYAWANEATTPSYVPSSSYQWNSMGGNVSITRSGIGTYNVTFPGQTFNGGTVQVTAYGSGPEQCKVASWGAPNVNVVCFNASGAPVDTVFSVDFASALPNATTAAYYLWADQPSAASYTPSPTYQSGLIGGIGPITTPATIARTATGVYSVVFPRMGSSSASSHVQVTAYGWGSETCKVDNWNNSATDGSSAATVRCFSSSGAAVDTLFTTTYSSNAFIIP